MAASRQYFWEGKKAEIKGVLLDITGVLYDGGDGNGKAIEGSVDAIIRLREAGLPVRFCTNETQTTRKSLVQKLKMLGFDLPESVVFPPIPAMCNVLRERKLRPHLLIHPDASSDFNGVDQSNPNCVVLGDAAEVFSYENVNKAFQILVSMEKPVLFSLGAGKYYKHEDSLHLDVGAYMKALEYACDIKSEIVGKPSPLFFNAVLEEMNIKPENAIMVGDDIVSDVGGAQACGIFGIQVRTGKFRPRDENHPTVKPDGIVDNLAEAVSLLLQ